MNSGYPNPSQILPLFFKINRQARIRWTITQDSATPNTTGWTWQLFVKRFAGARQNVINLTLGNGLRYEVYSDTILVADFSSLQTDIEEGEYYYELVRTDIETTWQEGAAYFQFAKTSTSAIEESNFTINVDSNGSPITLAVASSQTINITGLTQAQADARYDKLIDSAVALTDAATIDITAAHHTLTTASSRTFTKSYTGDSVKIAITLNATSATFTLPTGDKGIYNGTPSGTNTLVVTGATSGDVIIVAVEKVGSVNIWVGRNSIR